MDVDGELFKNARYFTAKNEPKNSFAFPKGCTFDGKVKYNLDSDLKVKNMTLRSGEWKSCTGKIHVSMKRCIVQRVKLVDTATNRTLWFNPTKRMIMHRSALGRIRRYRQLPLEHPVSCAEYASCDGPRDGFQAELKAQLAEIGKNMALTPSVVSKLLTEMLEQEERSCFQCAFTENPNPAHEELFQKAKYHIAKSADFFDLPIGRFSGRILFELTEDGAVTRPRLHSGALTMPGGTIRVRINKGKIAEFAMNTAGGAHGRGWILSNYTMSLSVYNKEQGQEFASVSRYANLPMTDANVQRALDCSTYTMCLTLVDRGPNSFRSLLLSSVARAVKRLRDIASLDQKYCTCLDELMRDIETFSKK